MRDALAHPRPIGVGIEEVCRILDVSRARCHELRKQADFPPQIGPGVYLEAAIVTYAAGRNRKAGRPTAPAGVVMCSCSNAHLLGATDCPNRPGNAGGAAQ